MGGTMPFLLCTIIFSYKLGPWLYSSQKTLLFFFFSKSFFWVGFASSLSCEAPQKANADVTSTVNKRYASLELKEPDR